MYADDTICLARSRDEAQELLNVISEYCDQWNLVINASKTQVIVFRNGGKVTEEKLTYKGTELDYTDTASYLGFVLHFKGSWSVNSKARLMKASKALGALRKRIYRFEALWL